MNVRKNTFLIFLLLLLCVMLPAGCFLVPGLKRNFLSANDKKIIDQIQSAVLESEAIFSDLSDLIRHQMQESATYIQGYKKATQEGTLYDIEPYEQLIRANKVKTAALLNQCNSVAQRLERMDISGHDNVRMVQDAALKYFSILADGLEELDSLLRFAVDQADANKPLADFDAGKYEEIPLLYAGDVRCALRFECRFGRVNHVSGVHEGDL